MKYIIYKNIDTANIGLSEKEKDFFYEYLIYIDGESTLGITFSNKVENDDLGGNIDNVESDLSGLHWIQIEGCNTIGELIIMFPSIIDKV